jgi:2-polyprenyl-3-methyl-5-hydroxy-6-metoxy-1,4-benzoquinol methylase
MPFSHNRFDEHMERAIKFCAYDNWLDIGAGAGKHGKMIRKLLPDANITGIERELDYIGKYKLQNVYDTVRPIDALDLMMHPTQTYEGIILGDVLEHLPKSQGIDLVHFLIYRCKTMIIIYPIGRIQNEYKGSKYEAHVSVWGLNDFKGLNLYGVELHPQSHFVVIRGYIDD